ncbi:MAG TPA: hypothetical protein VM123_16755 [archaeon]|nr:hypothetical protein [archaeon]
MQVRGQFFHLDETCPVFKHLKEGEACFYKSQCDAICKLNDGTAEYKKMRLDLDFRAFPESWKKKEKDVLTEVAKVIGLLEKKGTPLDVKRMKLAYGFHVAKRISQQG